MTLLDFEARYADILSAEIKAVPQKVATLFDVARFPHYETVISNFYAFYFDPRGEHGLSDLFLAALSEIICRKYTDFRILDNLNLCTVEREVCTTNGKYIDIVIKEPSDLLDVPENAVIIENKIYANLYNDLNEYYDCIQASNKKIGVVLSLRKEQSLPGTFVNITHQELVTQIEQSSGLYFLNAEAKQLVIFKEFIQNIKSMSSSSDLSEQYDFYFKHEDKIREVSALYNNLVADVYKQVNNACEKLDMGLELKSIYHSSLRYFTSSKSPVLFTIWLADLMNGKAYLDIIIELNEAGMKHLETINKIDFTADERALLKETTRVRRSYIHYAHKVTQPVSTDQIKNFTDYIYNEITHTPLKSIFIKIENCLAGIS